MSGEGLQVAPRGLHLRGPGPVAPAGRSGCGWPRSHMHLVGLLWGRGCHRTAQATEPPGEGQPGPGGELWCNLLLSLEVCGWKLWAQAAVAVRRGVTGSHSHFLAPASSQREATAKERRHGEGRDEGTGREEAMRKENGRVRCGGRRWTGPRGPSMDSGRGEGRGAERRPRKRAFRQS